MTILLPISGVRALLAEDYDARRAAGMPLLQFEEAGRLARSSASLRDLDAQLRTRRVMDHSAPGAVRFVPSNPAGGPLTIDLAACTVEVIWSTGALSRNFVQSLGWIMEELDVTPAAVRMAWLSSGRAPVLDSHRRGGAAHVLGRVLSARLSGGRGYDTLQFSTAADVDSVWQRVADGTLRGISAGYRVHRYDTRFDPTIGETIHRAVDWEPYEISVVPVPVDSEAMTR